MEINFRVKKKHAPLFPPTHTKTPQKIYKIFLKIYECIVHIIMYDVAKLEMLPS
jgi:hypothetical protein